MRGFTRVSDLLRSIKWELETIRFIADLLFANHQVHEEAYYAVITIIENMKMAVHNKELS